MFAISEHFVDGRIVFWRLRSGSWPRLPFQSAVCLAAWEGVFRDLGLGSTGTFSCFGDFGKVAQNRCLVIH